MKICSTCNVSKALEDFGWRYFGTPKAYKEVRCKRCKSKATLKARNNKIERELLANAPEETICPCDCCFNNKTCKIECASYRCWERTGV